MRHLVIGASGQVGEQLVRKIVSKNEEVIGTFFSTSLYGFNNKERFTSKIPEGVNYLLDIRKDSDVHHTLDNVRPDIVYICSANTKVDYCEENPIETCKSNIIGPKNIVDGCLKLKNKPLVVFYSTDYIFDGELGPYKETDLPNPICEYGKQKLYAEHYISCNYEKFIIVRTNWVFGYESQGKNFAQRLIHSLQQNNKASIPCDEFGNPTLALDLAEMTYDLAKKNYNQINSGSCVINLCGKDYISKYDFAIKIATTFNLDTNLISKIESNKTGRLAKRPLRGGLITNKITDLLGRQPYSCDDSLLCMKSEMRYIK